ncbi:FAD-dependent monooxygenase [uncultured Parasphingopyxis sp.]|uniref:NAD(P)/FAD-dependent oxidoreductase n=1 Tax=uncultured Parasphingopyxis sp. TaxID=1547918 RepID=UPI00263114AE|nr:FAD-dependent monooxygenase [uncultured Parasphingopyxis sp.]
MRRTAALIVGGGPAGSAAAIALARGGAEPVLVERQAEIGDALCGGFLSWRTLAQLDALGLDQGQLGGHRIDRVAIFAGDRTSESKLPHPSMGLSRHRLDTLLLARAKAEGAAILHGIGARSAAGPGEVLLDNDDVMDADALFLATGKHELRGLKRDAVPEEDRWMGLRYRFAPNAAMTRLCAGAIELHLFDHGYAGLLLQEDGSANLCMALRKSRLSEAEGDPASLLERLVSDHPALAQRVEAGAPVAQDAIGLVPYGWRARETQPGLFRLGDQAAVIPSLAGEGLGIAIASGTAAAEAYLVGGPDAAPRFQRDFARRAKRPLALAGLFKSLAEKPASAIRLARLARLPGLVSLASRLTRIA